MGILLYKEFLLLCVILLFICLIINRACQNLLHLFLIPVIILVKELLKSNMIIF